MDIYILRHGIARARSDTAPGPDSQRRLTAEGARKIRRIAATLKAREISIDLIVSSPFLRAKQTAEIVAEVYRSGKRLTLSSALEPDGNPKELIDELHKKHGRRKSVLLVGHEPYLGRLISLLISGDTGIAISLKKGGLCKLSVDTLDYGRCATLEWLLSPSHLKGRG